MKKENPKCLGGRVSGGAYACSVSRFKVVERRASVSLPLLNLGWYEAP